MRLSPQFFKVWLKNASLKYYTKVWYKENVKSQILTERKANYCFTPADRRPKSSALANYRPRPVSAGLARDGSGDPNIQPALLPSLFSNVPPTINFVLPNEKGQYKIIDISPFSFIDIVSECSLYKFSIVYRHIVLQFCEFTGPCDVSLSLYLQILKNLYWDRSWILKTCLGQILH